jgi:putative pyruvate formate lyase activating enzyme
LELQARGAYNINLVTPTHYTPQIIDAVRTARGGGLRLPVVWNTSGYETAATVESLSDTVDIYLTDFKYFDDKYGARYSGVTDYRATAQKALAAMTAQIGTPQFGADGMMTRGVIVRHLTLPGLLADSMKILRYLYAEFGDRVFVSIMSQYTPTAGLPDGFPELAAPVPKKQYRALVSYARNLGITNALIQYGETASESFIPEFD